MIIIDKILKGYSLRIYPTKEQQGLITRTFGCVRFVYNKMLDMQISRYKNNKNSGLDSSDSNICNIVEHLIESDKNK